MCELRTAKTVPGADRIYTAGEKEYYRAEQALAQGLEITPGLQRDLKALQTELGLAQFDLGF